MTNSSLTRAASWLTPEAEMADPQPSDPAGVRSGDRPDADRGDRRLGSPDGERLSSDPDPDPDADVSGDRPPGLGEPAEHPDPPID